MSGKDSRENHKKFFTVLRGESKSLVVVGKNARMVALQSSGDRRPFFMVASYPYFVDLVKLIGPNRPVLGLIFREEAQLPQPYSIFLEAAAHVKTILERQPEGPYLLAGGSSGGTVAYEAAQQLRALGHQVELLVLFDTPNWCLMPGGTPPPEYTPPPEEMARPRRRRRMFDTPDWYLLPKAGIRTCLAAVRIALERMRKDYVPRDQVELAAAFKYWPDPYSGKVLLVKRHRGLPWQWRVLGPDYGWGEAVGTGLEICSVEAADHLEIFKSEVDRALVAQTLRRSFDEVDARAPGQLPLRHVPEGRKEAMQLARQKFDLPLTTH